MNKKPIISLLKNSNFYIILKVTLHLQLLQNIEYIPHIVQYILEPILTFFFYLKDCFIFAWMGPISTQRSIHVHDWTGQENFSNLFHTYTGIIFNI